MALHAAVEAFRDWLGGEYRSDGRLEEVRVLEGADAGNADLSVRLCTANRSFYEARVDLEQAQLQVGFATENRNVNEACEEMVLESGGDLDELLGDELCDLGEEPLPMEHFYERPLFRYIVRLPLETPEVLGDPALRRRVKAVLQACRILFQDCADEG